MTNLHEQFIIFTTLFIISAILDIILTSTTRECITEQSNIQDRLKIIFHLLTHHFFNTFLNFGWIIDNFYINIIHIIACIGVIIYWANNNYKCDYTIYVNDLCNWHKDKYFNDIFEIIGAKKYTIWHTIIHPLILLSIVAFSIYRISGK